jgi:hypothetical protein
MEGPEGVQEGGGGTGEEGAGVVEVLARYRISKKPICDAAYRYRISKKQLLLRAADKLDACIDASRRAICPLSPVEQIAI